MVRSLLREVEITLTRFEEVPAEVSREEYFACRELIRGAFAVCRTCWTAAGISRQSDFNLEPGARAVRPRYNAYLRRIFGIINAVRRAQELAQDPASTQLEANDMFWLGHQAPGDLAAPKERMSEYGILYADELAWLYNEAGQASMMQGELNDAYALLRQGRDFNALVEGYSSAGSITGERWCHSHLNLGIVQLELGRIQNSEAFIKRALARAKELKIEDLVARATGYLGLVKHIVGDDDRAQRCYDEAILLAVDIDNHRAMSIFYRHRSDLLRRMGEKKAARRDLRLSIAAANPAGTRI